MPTAQELYISRQIARNNFETAPTVKSLVDSNALLTTQGTSYESLVFINRPANTTAYPINSVIGNSTNAIITFQNMGAVGRDTYFTDCRLSIQSSTILTGMTSFRLHLYNASPVVLLDTATWDFATADITRYLGYIDIGSILDFGSNLWLQSDIINIKRRCISTSVFGFLVTNGAFTPTSGLVFNITLGGVSA